MSNDSLVCKLVEYNDRNKEINRAYIFYDHNLSSFGIRGGYESKKQKTYSFYSNNVGGVKNFIRTLFDKFSKLSVCLIKYDCLPEASDDIDYTRLVLDDSRCNEIVGFDFWKEDGDAFGGNSTEHGFNIDSGHVDTYLQRCLKSIVDVYNDY